jgi:hypothetical protein
MYLQRELDEEKEFEDEMHRLACESDLRSQRAESLDSARLACLADLESARGDFRAKQELSLHVHSQRMVHKGE